MNVLVAGFITIDKIELNLRQITSIGGPPCYAGLLCARFGFDVTPLTKVGPDFPDEQIVWLSRNGLQLRAVDRSSTKKTTRFKLLNKGEERSLYLVERCEDLTIDQVPEKQFNASLISPLAHEISVPLFEEVRRHSDFCFLDPQGFVRMFDGSGKVYIDGWNDEKVPRERRRAEDGPRGGQRPHRDEGRQGSAGETLEEGPQGGRDEGKRAGARARRQQDNPGRGARR